MLDVFVWLVGGIDSSFYRNTPAFVYTIMVCYSVHRMPYHAEALTAFGEYCSAGRSSTLFPMVRSRFLMLRPRTKR